MNNSINNLIRSLDGLANSIISASSENRILLDIYGWNCPPLTRNDLAGMVQNISSKLKKININQADDLINTSIVDIEKKIESFKVQTLPQLFTGNSYQAGPAFMALLAWINSIIEPLFQWEILQEKGALPKEITKKLRAIRSELDALTPDKESLDSKIKAITEAYEAAESLPTDLQELRDARAKVSSISSDSAVLFGKIDKFHSDIEGMAKSIIEKEKEAAKLVALCEEAYKITTTKGLAAAFELKAKNLTTTVWGWVGGLLVALLAGGWIGSTRFNVLSASLSLPNPHWGVIWMQFSLSLVSFAAPLWLAWLATKQISQRFRLAEDYAFKASIAKAYEGYRKEAARIDPEFESRLFSSALTRLEEAPLRLLENEHYSSPYQELLNSKSFQVALETFPDLKEKFYTLLNNILARKGKNGSPFKMQNIDLNEK